MGARRRCIRAAGIRAEDAGAELAVAEVSRRDVVFMAGENLAQGTLEYALTVLALLAMVVAFAALWRAAADGALAGLVHAAASHVLAGDGFIDISLY